MTRKTTLVIVILVVAGLAGAVLLRRHSGAPPAASSAPGTRTVLRLRLSSFALSLHPLKMADVESRQVATMLHAGLIFQDDTGKVHPLLASSWTHTGNEWRFALNPEVTFSDGGAATSTEVVASICAAMQPASPWAWALKSIQQSMLPDGKSIECSGLQADGAQAVRITEARASSTLLDALSGPAGWILPTGAREQPYGVVPGLGPYKVAEVVADNRIVLAARKGGAITPPASEVQFKYVADDSVAASLFLTGQLDILDLTSPQLIDLVLDPAAGVPRGGGALVQRSWDRIRLVIVNEQRLQSNKGFAPEQARAFINAFAATVDRKALAERAKGGAVPLTSPFPPVPDINVAAGEPSGLPAAHLTIITESDAYSDLIAASLPTSLGKVKIDYKGIDKAVLINSLVKGDFDLASILIEATVHSADFWRSFFTPGSPFTAFGKPIEGIGDLDIDSAVGLKKVGTLVAEKGNWVGLLMERRLQASRPGVAGVLFSGSGQTNYAFVTRR